MIISTKKIEYVAVESKPPHKNHILNERMIYMGKTSAAVKNRYNDKAYDRINLIVPKGQKDVIKAYAESKGESLNGFINRTINEAMKKE